VQLEIPQKKNQIISSCVMMGILKTEWVAKYFILFARLISHRPAVLSSQNESATSNQPQPASSTLLSEQTSTSHQPPANRTGWDVAERYTEFKRAIDWTRWC
jgi:hypothetical protein